eukprot:scaffold13536_cov60-Phaeocystis_antarctica.AAC.1
MWLTKLNSGDNGRPGSAVDDTAEGLAQFSRVVDPIPPPTVVSLTSAGSVTAFDRRRPLAIPETVPLSLGTPRATSADPGTFETMTTRHEP